MRTVLRLVVCAVIITGMLVMHGVSAVATPHCEDGDAVHIMKSHDHGAGEEGSAVTDGACPDAHALHGCAGLLRSPEDQWHPSIQAVQSEPIAAVLIGNASGIPVGSLLLPLRKPNLDFLGISRT
jgi:hypothetical protein